MSSATPTQQAPEPGRPTTNAPAPGKQKRSQRSKSEARLGWFLAGPAFFIMVLVIFYPLLQAVWDSLFSYRLTAPDDRAFVGLGNYATVLTDAVFWRDLGVTVLITVVTVLVELVLGFALALVMHKAIRGTRGFVRTVILIPYGLVTVVSAYAWYYMFSSDSGYMNSWLDFLPGVDENLNWFAQAGTALTVIMLSEIWKTTPFISLLLLAGLAQVPQELEEAAAVDGANWFQRLWRVIIPNMKASIMVAVLFRALDAFRIFDAVFIMTQGAYGTEVLSLLAYRTSIGRLEIGLGSAVSVLLFLAVALIALVSIKIFKVDLTGQGGSKK
ncbi:MULTISPECIES: carbohydrate ABC transporter permease [Auritidibacter]|uniref:carbohydrate ABC transporter permease n=1 Tax=Auritidibacter TaxID=1160973 RepID=UPI001691C109|nr:MULTISPECIES: sugar ABC transporter permease [Auritidibacter]NIH71854.1 multiple sugar transport system permease protein [Auritidibacter ignavus]WGH80505.1 sugar ABC transporter permease [Auritidibacter ignavus]WGH85192.1 sugar ABC transporter permease [Auritidibacter ignavus]WGH87480.1 sugar ABC transporter permease [Auritidibacter ignavus]WGH89757.1 sugar ABC transporter permease [Auritidibacter ignavus]